MTQNERRAWAAGFFDGEGSVGCYKHGQHQACRATASQTDVRLLRRFKRVVDNTGHITGPYHLKNRKAWWVWNAHSYRESVHALFQIWDWLSPPKRQQAEKAFQDFERYKKTVRSYARKGKR